MERMIIARVVVEIGCTFEYARSLTIDEIGDVLSYVDAMLEIKGGMI